MAENVKKLRLKMDLSQEGLAELGGFHRTFVSKVERKVANPSVDTLDHLANVLGVQVIELFRPA